jgi:hypothetical protein
VIGDFFGQFFLMTQVSQIFVLHFYTKKVLHLTFDQNLFALRFGRFFHKLIWSPWSCGIAVPRLNSYETLDCCTLEKVANRVTRYDCE